MQCNDRLGSVSGAQKRREHVLNDLTHVPMPRRLHWGLLGALLELISGPSRGGEVATFDNGRRKEGKKTGGGGEEEEEDESAEG